MATTGAASDHPNGPDPEGCSHYRNKCEILAPCCAAYYRCHRCHNDEREHLCGLLDRSSIARIKCVGCGHEQSPSERCGQCGVAFAEHVCLECNLYRQADTVNGLFHCPDCGICRVGKGLGPGGSHWHCMSCCACLPNVMDKAEHAKICRSDGLKNECTICFEDMHQSTDQCVIGPHCGHFLHRSCFDAYLSSGKYKCPLCQKSLIDEGVVEKARRRTLWTNIGMEVCHAMAILLAMIYLPERAGGFEPYEHVHLFAWSWVLFVSRSIVLIRPRLVGQVRLHQIRVFSATVSLFLYLFCTVSLCKRAGSLLARFVKGWLQNIT